MSTFFFYHQTKSINVFFFFAVRFKAADGGPWAQVALGDQSCRVWASNLWNFSSYKLEFMSSRMVSLGESTAQPREVVTTSYSFLAFVFGGESSCESRNWLGYWGYPGWHSLPKLSGCFSQFGTANANAAERQNDHVRDCLQNSLVCLNACHEDPWRIKSPSLFQLEVKGNDYTELVLVPPRI